MEEILTRTATEVAGAVRAGRVSSRDLVEVLLARIDEVNPGLNALVEIRREHALQAAERADAAIAEGAHLGPLHGVPITVKESLQVAGMRTTWGNPAFGSYVADWDATIVRRLVAAGAIVVGKSNVAFMLGDFGQSANEVYGATANPWNPALTPGGSSGGAAAAVAAGLSFLEYGSDVVGSVRIPAAFCGVYGLRPSVGTVPLTGLQPPGPPAPATETAYMSALGPLGRSATDVRTALQVTGGPEHPAAQAYSWRLARPRHERLGEFRVGFVLDDERVPVTSEVTKVLAGTVDQIRRSGVTLVEGWPAGVDPVRQAETFAYHAGVFLAHQAPDAHFPDPSRLVAEERARMEARAAWGGHFREFVDVFLSPVAFTPAFPHDARPFAERMIDTPEGVRRYDDLSFWVAAASLTGLPTLAAPAGTTADGRPVGLQVMGPMHEDDTAITFAELLADVIGGYRPPFP